MQDSYVMKCLLISGYYEFDIYILDFITWFIVFDMMLMFQMKEIS